MTVIMRKTIIIFFAILTCGLPSAAKSKTLSNFIDKVASSLVSFEYSFSLKASNSKAKMTGEGTVKVQGNSFVMDGNGLEVWCDGSTRWTVDRLAEEALVESVDDSADSYATNPALMITSVDAAFKEDSFGASKFQGKAVDASVLSPLTKGKYSMDISQLKLFFKTGTSILVGAEVRLNDGSVSEIVVSNIVFSDPTDDKGSFRFDEKTLTDSYVVTDLR